MADKKELKKGLISVVMSNYNTPINYLKESIDSVLNQTYSNFEFIIIDDGSTDDSLEFIKSYDDPRIKLIVNEENIGLTKSLNEGFEVAQGEFITRMDSDDICYPERFEKQIEYIKGHPDTIVCGAWAKVIGKDNVLRIEPWCCGSIEDMESYRINLLFSNDPTIIHPSVVFNHRLLLKYHIKYDDRYKYSQDYRMWVECSRYANIHILNEYLIKYRKHEKAISSYKYEEQEECVQRIAQEQLDYLHLLMDKDIMPLHNNFLRRFATYNSRTQKWLKTIIIANKKYKIYNQKKLKQVLWYRWTKICYAELSQSNFSRCISIIISLPFRCKTYLFKIRKEYKQKK